MNEAYNRLLQDVTFEVFPTDMVIQEILLQPKNTVLSLTSSPRVSLEDSVKIARTLHQAGYSVHPAFAARRFRDRQQARQILQLLASAKIEDIIVIGGDIVEPLGPFDSAESFLREFEQYGATFRSIGVAGYPEGHPVIPAPKLLEALRSKQKFAEQTGTRVYVATQMCFSSDAIVKWAVKLKEQGIMLPIKVGVPGIFNLQKLIRFAIQCGVGNSLAYLKKHQKRGREMVSQSTFAPFGMIDRIANHPLLADTSIDGLHVYTYNNLGESVGQFRNWSKLRLSGSPR